MRIELEVFEQTLVDFRRIRAITAPENGLNVHGRRVNDHLIVRPLIAIFVDLHHPVRH